MQSVQIRKTTILPVISSPSKRTISASTGTSIVANTGYLGNAEAPTRISR